MIFFTVDRFCRSIKFHRLIYIFHWLIVNKILYIDLQSIKSYQIQIATSEVLALPLGVAAELSVHYFGDFIWVDKGSKTLGISS